MNEGEFPSKGVVTALLVLAAAILIASTFFGWTPADIFATNG
jgi:hypothetical protein